jgi:hypothetical protein
MITIIQQKNIATASDYYESHLKVEPSSHRLRVERAPDGGPLRWLPCGSEH